MCIIVLAMAALTPASAEAVALPGATVCPVPPPTSGGSANTGSSLMFVQQAQAVSATIANRDLHTGSPPFEPGLSGYQALYGFDSPGNDLGKAICGMPVQKCASACNGKQTCAGFTYALGAPSKQCTCCFLKTALSGFSDFGEGANGSSYVRWAAAPYCPFAVTLSGPAAHVTWFEDRPLRGSGVMPVSEFTEAFSSLFAGDLPNAVLTGTNAVTGAPATAILTLCTVSIAPDGSVVYTARSNSLPVTNTQRELLRSVLRSSGTVALDPTATTMYNVALFIDSVPLTFEASLSQTWLMNPSLEPQSFESQLIPGTAVAASRRRKLKQVLAAIEGVAETVKIVFNLFDPSNSTSSTTKQLNEMQATLNAVAVGTNSILNAVSGAQSTEDVNSALSIMGVDWVASTNAQGSPYIIGDGYTCLVAPGDTGAGASWEETMFGFTGDSNIQQVLQDLACAMPSASSVTGNARSPSSYCSSVNTFAGGNLGYVQTLFSNVVGCGSPGANGVSSSQCSAVTLAQSPQYMVSQQISVVVNQAVMAMQLCNTIAGFQNDTASNGCSSAWMSPPYLPTNFCTAFASGSTQLDAAVPFEVLLEYVDALVYNASSGGLPWWFYMWRNYDMSASYFVPAQNGLLGSGNVLDQEPGYGNPFFGFSWVALNPDSIIPPLWVNLGTQVIAPEGYALTAASFSQLECSWCGASGVFIESSGNYNLLNMAMLSAPISQSASTGISFGVPTWEVMANPGGSGLLASALEGLPTNCYQPNLAWYEDNGYVVFDNIPSAGTQAACAINPQYISLMPVTVPINYIVVGIGFTMWQCSNYVAAASGQSPNMVLGLQLVGREVVYDNVTNEITWGGLSTAFPNNGYCGTSIIAATTAGNGTPKNVASTLNGPFNGYYPPADADSNPSASSSSPTYTHYDALQVYADVSIIDYGGSNKDADTVGIPATGNFFYVDDITATSGPATPAFVQGAALSIGTISAGSFFGLPQVPAMCYNWSSAELSQIDAGVPQSVVCASNGPTYRFTQGNNANTPGCGSCVCCELLA
ncbi:hypothetical protein FOA52_015821 [Chlamydomonas sp. UWO 241]|nr:hypothetical protein FOA52_015821 [Chlamydomonas sp. UWO 241]